MRSVLRVYVAWRLARMLRPVFGVAVLAAAVLSLHFPHVKHEARHSGTSVLTRGALVAERDLSATLRRAFTVGPSTR